MVFIFLYLPGQVRQISLLSRYVDQARVIHLLAVMIHRPVLVYPLFYSFLDYCSYRCNSPLIMSQSFSLSVYDYSYQGFVSSTTCSASSFVLNFMQLTLSTLRNSLHLLLSSFFTVHVSNPYSTAFQIIDLMTRCYHFSSVCHHVTSL